MANFKNTGDIYVSKSGSDANAGTDPDLPKLTIQGAIDVATADQKIIVGDGIYSESELAGISSGIIIQGDGIVILEGNNTLPLLTNASGSNTYELHDLVIINYSFSTYFTNTNNIIRMQDCVIINSPVFGRKGNNTVSVTLNRCKLINSNYDVIWFGVNYNVGSVSENWNRNIFASVFINSTVLVNVSLNNCYIDSGIIFDQTSSGDSNNVNQSNFNVYLSSITYDGVLYNNFSAYQTANPTVDQNSFNSDGLFNRLSNEIETLDFTVQGSSPLLGTGENGTNIGNVRRGLPQSRISSSIQNGTNTNVVFDGNVWQVQNGQTTGSIETDVIDFGLTVKSPRLTVKGLVNFLDNVPDFDNTLLNPNKLDIEARYAIIGEDITLKTYKPFLLNERILLDVGGLSNGEDLFDWSNTVTQPMKEIQLRITLRQDYNPA